MMRTVDAAPTRPGAEGTPVAAVRTSIRIDVVGTAGFAVAGALGALSADLAVVTAVVSLVLFAVGVAAFIWSYVTAAERSRTDEVGVANLYLLTGTTAPRPVKRTMNALLAAQVLISLAVAAIGYRRLTGDNDLNPLAFAILAPMFGLGLNGWWASHHGAFGPRILTSAAGRRPARRPAPDTEQTPPQ